MSSYLDSFFAFTHSWGPLFVLLVIWAKTFDICRLLIVMGEDLHLMAREKRRDIAERKSRIAGHY